MAASRVRDALEADSVDAVEQAARWLAHHLEKDPVAPEPDDLAELIKRITAMEARVFSRRQKRLFIAEIVMFAAMLVADSVWDDRTYFLVGAFVVLMLLNRFVFTPMKMQGVKDLLHEAIEKRRTVHARVEAPATLEASEEEVAIDESVLETAD